MIRRWSPFCFMFLLLVVARPSFAQTHEPIRRLVVFPFQTESSLTKAAEEAWWDLRERLTENKRFLIASKNFMEVKDVYQPRGQLQPADAIILGRLLDAHALVTVTIQGHTLSLYVYESKNGGLLWQRKMEMHPALPVSKQLRESLRKMVLDFTASIPYQGFVIIDPLIGKPSYQQTGRTYIKADVGAGAQVKVGDPAQVITLAAKNLRPLFEDGGDMDVLAEGVVAQSDRHIITIEITRMKEGAKFEEGSLVHLPLEFKRLQDSFSLTGDLVDRAGLQTLGGGYQGLTREQQERKPLVTSLSFIANLALVLLLAF